jgi:hypothetical protein
MAAPILQLKRGTTAPGSIFYESQPIYDKTAKILYIGDSGGTGSGTGSAVAGASVYAAANEQLTKSVAGSSVGSVKLYDAQATQKIVTLRAPAIVTNNYNFTLPAAVPSSANGYYLTSDTSGNTSWAAVSSGASDISAVTGLGTGVATFLGTPSSANLAAAVTDETGSGALVFGTSPAITTSLTTGSTTFALVNTTATTVNFAGAATTLSIGASTGTTTVNNNLTVTGNLTVSGTTTILNTQTIQVEDRFIELGLVDNTAPASTTTWDLAVGFNYFASSAKKSALVWVDNTGFALTSDLSVSSDTTADANSPQLTINTFAPLAVNDLYIGSLGTATNQVIDSSKNIINVTIDCGTY